MDFDLRKWTFTRAVSSGNVGLVTLMLRETPDIHTRPAILEIAVQNKQVAVLKVLLEHNKNVALHKIDIDEVNGIQYTPLCLAVRRKLADCAAVLLDYGADPNTRCWDNGTALHMAAAIDCVECARLLVERGVDVTITDKYGRTAADRHSANPNSELYQVLLGAGGAVTKAARRE